MPRSGSQDHASTARLAIAIAAAFGVARVHAQSVDVTDCGDAGPGTLREAVGTAIAIHILGCPEIDLSSGPLVSPLAYLHITGSPTTLRVTGPGRAITHTGNGGLDLVSLDITGGDVVSNGTDIASGGCIWSGGYVSLTGTTVHECRATATLQPPIAVNSAIGGGIYAVGSVFLDRSVVRDNTLVDAPGPFSASSGAGVFSGDQVVMTQSTISGNAIVSTVAPSEGGGFYAAHGVSLVRSTISGNSAPVAAGAAFGRGSSMSYIEECTVSGNQSGSGPAGLRSRDATLHVSNSTITANTASAGLSSPIGVGLEIYASPAALTLDSTIIAGNADAGVPDDIASHGAAPTVAGAHNLVQASGFALPADTLSVDPMLAALADNGGRTWTHALLPGSPAIDHGDNPLGATTDQRGDGFARVAGAHADIGAFEWQDPIFTDGFDD